ncbi:hypothetical protein L195_g052272 [Trifolium pratense]|uniref:DUF7081 domain-containing protein n=1 Tax=Trifolium pratense TaxID=57577 RepID=A0A2K3K470_TRIPR|nr:hypothetical protein L195_g052272 [Trifolium pratense]
MESDGNSDNGGGSKKFSNLTPVPPEESGVGLPYAPENFPNPGDIWRWKAGKRISNNGNFRDRYLYLPPRLSAPANRTSFRGGFASKLAVERYVRERFPKANISDFFASFSWRIPSGLPGDIWRSKVGKMISSYANFRGRYLYLHRRLSAPANQTSFRGGFASKLAFERCVREKFPKVDISDLFASFSWRISSGLPGICPLLRS